MKRLVTFSLLLTLQHIHSADRQALCAKHNPHADATTLAAVQLTAHDDQITWPAQCDKAATAEELDATDQLNISIHPLNDASSNLLETYKQVDPKTRCCLSFNITAQFQISENDLQKQIATQRVYILVPEQGSAIKRCGNLIIKITRLPDGCIALLITGAQSGQYTYFQSGQRIFSS